MNVSLSFTLPVWLCYYTVAAIYVMVFTTGLAVSALVLFRLFRTWVVNRGLERRWIFWTQTRLAPNYANTFLELAMREWRQRDKRAYYQAVSTSLGNGLDFAVYIKRWYGDGYDKAVADAEKHYTETQK